uniref:Uncharacterized protein n=1 Tax=Arion vulgaris TaxID=1028688 RepID=A0A0B7B0F3_9EUPU
MCTNQHLLRKTTFMDLSDLHKQWLFLTGNEGRRCSELKYTNLVSSLDIQC